MVMDTKDEDELDQDIKGVYGADENPLAYMIEPKGSADMISKDTDTTKEDLEHILD